MHVTFSLTSAASRRSSSPSWDAKGVLDFGKVITRDQRAANMPQVCKALPLTPIDIATHLIAVIALYSRACPLSAGECQSRDGHLFNGSVTPPDTLTGNLQLKPHALHNHPFAVGSIIFH